MHDRILRVLLDPAALRVRVGVPQPAIFNSLDTHSRWVQIVEALDRTVLSRLDETVGVAPQKEIHADLFDELKLCLPVVRCETQDLVKVQLARDFSRSVLSLAVQRERQARDGFRNDPAA